MAAYTKSQGRTHIVNKRGEEEVIFLWELRKYTLSDRAGTEEFNDDRIASECSQRVHLNIPQV